MHKTHFWSDSTIVLNWIDTPSYTLKSFVANRVVEIQATTEAQNWHRVPTEDNPADLISRGQVPQDFLKNRLWIHGPQWLSRDSDTWPELSFKKHEIPETRRDPSTLLCKLTQEHNKPESEILKRFSSFKSDTRHRRIYIINRGKRKSDKRIRLVSKCASAITYPCKEFV